MAGVYPPTETLAVGSAQTELRSASLNAQKHCPLYNKDLLISGLPQTLDAPGQSGMKAPGSNSSL